MPITFAVTVCHADGTLSERLVNSFAAAAAERQVTLTLPKGDAVLLACPFTLDR